MHWLAHTTQLVSLKASMNVAAKMTKKPTYL